MDYETREIMRYHKDIHEVEQSSKQSRLDGYRELLEVCSGFPETVAERIEWLLDGNYGFWIAIGH